MTPDTERSERVIEDYKKRKLAGSALHRIQDLVHGFEQDRDTDRRLARLGVVIILALLAIAVYLFMSGEAVTLS